AAVLVPVAIHAQPQLQRSGVSNLIPGHEPRAERPEGIAALPLDPLAAALELECPLGQVIDDQIACNVCQRLTAGYSTCALADENAELHFPIGLLASRRQHHVIVRTADRR